MAEVWNGTTWKLQATSPPTNSAAADFTGVSCWSTIHCTAVGEYFNSVLDKQVTLAETKT